MVEFEANFFRSFFRFLFFTKAKFCGMYSDKIKYSAPLPGEEFRRRALTVPAEAVKTLCDIDFQFGRDTELCLSILESVFRGTESVTKILQESKGLLRRENKNGAPWRAEATINRNIRKTLKEQEVERESRLSKNLEKDLARLLEKQRDLVEQAQEKANKQKKKKAKEEEKARAREENRPEVPYVFEEAEPVTKETMGKFGPAYRRLGQDIKEIRGSIAQSIEDFARLVEDVAVFRADPNNERFSAEEESIAKARLEERGGAEKEGKASEEQWREFLESMIVAILQAASVQSARAKMEILGAQVIEMCPRDAKSLLEFAGDLDKARQFAVWQAKIFNKDPIRVEEINIFLDQKAMVTFAANLKMVEAANWNFIDVDAPGAFKMLLTRLRGTAVINPTAVPVMPVKASGAKRGAKGKEKDETEEEEEATPPTKKKAPAKPIAAAVEEEEEPIIAALTRFTDKLTGTLKDTITDTLGKTSQQGTPAGSSQGSQEEVKEQNGNNQWNTYQGGRGGRHFSGSNNFSRGGGNFFNFSREEAIFQEEEAIFQEEEAIFQEEGGNQRNNQVSFLPLCTTELQQGTPTRTTHTQRRPLRTTGNFYRTQQMPRSARQGLVRPSNNVQ